MADTTVEGLTAFTAVDMAISSASILSSMHLFAGMHRNTCSNKYKWFERVNKAEQSWDYSVSAGALTPSQCPKGLNINVG